MCRELGQTQLCYNRRGTVTVIFVKRQLLEMLEKLLHQEQKSVPIVGVAAIIQNFQNLSLLH